MPLNMPKATPTDRWHRRAVMLPTTHPSMPVARQAAPSYALRSLGAAQRLEPAAAVAWTAQLNWPRCLVLIQEWTLAACVEGGG